MKNIILFVLILSFSSCSDDFNQFGQTANTSSSSSSVSKSKQEESTKQVSPKERTSSTYLDYLNPYSYDAFKNLNKFQESDESINFTKNAENKGLLMNTYYVTVRLRPVGMAALRYVAVHGYIAKKNQKGEILETLSFDPSNSVGISDAKPEDASWGEVMVGTNVTEAEWESISKFFTEFSQSDQGYNLRKRNCCHAVIQTLIVAKFKVLKNKNEGIKFAYWANQSWNRINSVATLANYLDYSNVK